ncbi:MAG TPA: CoA ester lyase [Burkholderiales bacterium]|jgi:(S)-citramalyl-CoA lyase|nr:CoA ester lyase [Burkholderiales bacterium]
MREAYGSVRPRRSLLFVPGLRPDRFEKALEAGADIVCVDLEDAVARDRKAEARALTLPLFQKHARADIELMLRINALSTADGLKDLTAILAMGSPPPAIMIPKIRSAEEIQLIDALLSTGPAREIRFCVIIETNQGLERAHQIAKASPRIDSMILGAVDMSADLRCQKAWEPLLYARSRLVHAAASAGIDLLDVPFLNLEDPDGLREEARRCAALGFTGKASIHPRQLPIIHEAFTPDEKTVEKAKKVCAAFEQDATGLVVVDGELIELPVVRSMYRVLSIAERVAARR